MSDDKRSDVGTICLGWWGHLTNKEIGRSRSDLARLKRASGAAEALAIKAVHELNTKLTAEDFGLRSRPEQLALIAMTLAQVKEHTAWRLARNMGRGDPKPLSEIRFDSLIRTQLTAELSTSLRRALHATGQVANVAALAQDLFYWNDSTRARWCFDYYGAHDAAPNADKNHKETET